MKEPAVRIVGALLCALVFSLHHVRAYQATGGHYTVFATGHDVADDINDQTFQYATAARLFSVSRRLFVEDLKEYAAIPNAYPILPSVLVGGAAGLLGNLDLVWILFQIAGAVCTWLLCYEIVKRSTRAGPWLGAAAAWAVVLFSFGPRNMLLIGDVSMRNPLELTRLASPALAFPLMLWGLFAIAEALRGGRRADCVLAAVLLGAQFYVYYFYWVVICGVLAILGGLALLRRDRDLFKRICLIGGAGIAIGSPYVLMTKMTVGQNLWLLERVSQVTREPSPMGFLLIAVSVSCLALLQKKKSVDTEPTRWLPFVLLAAIGGAGIGLNLQILSGRDANHAAHYYNKVLQPIGLLLFTLVLAHLGAVRLKRFGSAIAAVAIVAMVGLAGYRQWSVGSHLARVNDTRNETYDLFRWASAHISPDKVVGTTDGRIILELPARTANFNYVPVAFRTRATEAEILTRYFYLSWLGNKSYPEARTELLSESAHRLSLFYMVTGHLFRSDELVAVVEGIWRDFERNGHRGPGRLDYIVFPRTAAPERLKANYPSAQIVYRNAAWDVWSLDGSMVSAR